MDLDDLTSTIQTFVSENFVFDDASKLTPELNLMDEGLIDSTGVLELVGFIEDTFEVAVADEDLVPENFASVERIASYVRGKLGGS